MWSIMYPSVSESKALWKGKEHTEYLNSQCTTAGARQLRRAWDRHREESIWAGGLKLERETQLLKTIQFLFWKVEASKDKRDSELRGIRITNMYYIDTCFRSVGSDEAKSCAVLGAFFSPLLLFQTESLYSLEFSNVSLGSIFLENVLDF